MSEMLAMTREQVIRKIVLANLPEKLKADEEKVWVRASSLRIGSTLDAIHAAGLVLMEPCSRCKGSKRAVPGESDDGVCNGCRYSGGFMEVGR